MSAGNFTLANSVPAADSSTRVLSAVPHIPQISVRLSPVSSMHPQLERTEKDLPHLNCGPTPVKPHRLEPAIATYLVKVVFVLVFLFDILGIKSLVDPKILRVLLKTHGKLLMS